ncbi:hypothetical protein [Aliidiomarina sanyensis]|uniref:Uncharacterized protein n=1 Tax=Aliidiomarina sanyensis TaxID=1249555 RepID=A0A432WB93_9GAMM|nr:hypothetical protein [Aliidiomarina sanyensis]RUO28762.1 hypothetical protein CWE11_10695 [Aliidiomarina sanyensis]
MSNEQRDENLAQPDNQQKTIDSLILGAKAIAVISIIAIVLSIAAYIAFAVRNEWVWAREPIDMAHFGGYISGTLGVLLALGTLSILVWSTIIQWQASSEALRANTKAFTLSEYRAAISAVLAELELKNKSFSIEQPMFFEGKGKGKEKTITTTMTYWDFFHGGLRDWAPGNSFDRVILVRRDWNDYFDTTGLMEETLRIDLHYYAVKISKLRYLIIRYLEEGGIPDLYLEELEDARLSKQYLAGPAFAVRGEIIRSRISKSVIKVCDASASLIEKMEPMIK